MKKTKDHLSDDEDDDNSHSTTSSQVSKKEVVSQQELERRQLESSQVIADSEISPAAYLFQNHEETDDMNIFEQQSQKIKCPFCDAVSYSIVEYRASFLGYMIAILSILVFGFLSIILMPFLVSLTKQALHRCAKCLNEVKSNSYFGFSSLEDKIIAVNIGNFGIILTRRYLLYIVVTITVGLLIYLFVINENTHNHEARPITKLQWADFRNDCGYSAYLKNPQLAMQKFDRHYYGQGISWDGYIIRVSLNEEDSLNFAYHSATIMIKMEPPEQEGSHGADLGLSLTERSLKLLKSEVDELKRGDHVRFNATIQSMGDSQHLHHLHTFDIKKIEGHKDVEAHVHIGGRYKFKQHEGPSQIV